ncbi:MAG: cupin domain-containing protein [Acetobacter papayae]|uniref:cupin domain-containing protein n=1 Tax=Acetobacter papayae TaxID=1076592 RepID=UPI0039EC4D09
MKRFYFLLSAILWATPLMNQAFAEGHQGEKIIADAGAVVWQPAPAIFPSGIKIAYLYGDLAKHEPFTLRVMMPPHSFIPLHTHNLDEMLTVISGGLDHYTGTSMKNATTHHMASGGFVHLPVNMAHALKAGDHPVILQVSGVGPFEMTYLNPRDDPRHQH